MVGMLESEDIDITVITVVYNCVKEIGATIESIIPLLDNKHELLIIDGGSTDGTLELLYSYSHPSYFIISEPDEGIYDAMNKGAVRAKGKWITYINCGDLLLKFPTVLDPLYDVVCNAVKIEDGIIYPQLNWRLHLYNTLPHQGIYYKKSTFKMFDTQFKIFADYKYNLYIYKNGVKILIDDEIVAFHSLFGISNSTVAKCELVKLLREESGFCWYLLSMVRFRILGLKKRIKKYLCVR